MSDIVIKAEGLSKAYSITHQRQHGTATLREALTHRVQKALAGMGSQQGTGKYAAEQFWALKDVSFTVRQGDRIGIVGRNGAGKSTLLKILSRITSPTSGRVEIDGRVQSLLEVGTGFHPELTGRENIFLNGSILGMSRAEIKKKFDEIVAFAEVEQFLDTPVKRYSSGMYVRLAFAVAAHLESEVLLVDEVLAVGDAAFQKKCLGKMQDISTQEGRTILFVSHNMSTIQNLCTTGILLKNGGIQARGGVGKVISEYFSNEYRCQLLNSWDMDSEPGNAALRIKKFQLLPDSDISAINVTTPLRIVVEFAVCQDSVIIDELYMLLKNIKGDSIFGSITACNCAKGLHMAAVHIPGDLLNEDTYTVDFYFNQNGVNIYQHHECLVFQVDDVPGKSTLCFDRRAGAVRPSLHWDCMRLADG